MYYTCTGSSRAPSPSPLDLFMQFVLDSQIVIMLKGIMMLLSYTIIDFHLFYMGLLIYKYEPI